MSQNLLVLNKRGESVRVNNYWFYNKQVAPCRAVHCVGVVFKALQRSFEDTHLCTLIIIKVSFGTFSDDWMFISSSRIKVLISGLRVFSAKFYHNKFKNKS